MLCSFKVMNDLYVIFSQASTSMTT